MKNQESKSLSRLWNNRDGFCEELFVDPTAINPMLMCPICMNVVNIPIQCRNGHLFCKSCLSIALRKKKKCPMCNVSTPSISELSFNDFANDCICALSINCTQNNCGWIGSLKNLDNHLTICSSFIVSCQNCGHRIKRKDSAVSMCSAADCQWSRCRKCCNMDQLEWHLVTCTHLRELVCCWYCGQHLKPSHIELHDCPKKTVMIGPTCTPFPCCPYGKFYGCGSQCTIRLKEEDMEEHLLNINNMAHTLAAVQRTMKRSDLPQFPSDYNLPPYTQNEMVHFEAIKSSVRLIFKIVHYVFGGACEPCRMECTTCEDYNIHIWISGKQCIQLSQYEQIKQEQSNTEISGKTINQIANDLEAIIHMIPRCYLGVIDHVDERVYPSEHQFCLLTVMKQEVWTLSQINPLFYFSDARLQCSLNGVDETYFPKQNHLNKMSMERIKHLFSS
jgi:hypothetical protein